MNLHFVRISSIFTGMTKIKMSNQAEQGSSAEFVEKRRASLERYLNRTAAHPILGVDPDFREFLEAGKLCISWAYTEMYELVILCRRFSGGRYKSTLWNWVIKHLSEIIILVHKIKSCKCFSVNCWCLTMKYAEFLLIIIMGIE
jgi:hypothetical protein